MSEHGNNGAEVASKAEMRQQQRHPVLEFGMLWRPNGSVPCRVGSALITNVSLGGVQFKARQDLQPEEHLLLELATDDGPVFLPGDVRYVKPGEDGTGTYGFRFQPCSKAERQAVAKYVLAINERDFASGA